MNNFAYISVNELIKKHPEEEKNRKHLEKIANRKAKRCGNCDEFEWKYGECGLCFSCTTGESDASDDYELLEK